MQQISSGNSGYITDLPYPPHFYKELLPLWQVTIARFLGRSAPAIDRAFSYCELGCGMGINLLVAAATNPNGYFVGVDFNARHIEIARAATAYAKLTNIHFIHTDFASFVRDNHFQFDFIACHGTWSWIAPQHQQTLIRIVKQSLKHNGLFYLHYMTHPGSTHLIPLQRMLADYAQQVAGTGEEKIRAAMHWLQQLAAAGAFVDQPHMIKHMLALSEKDSHYLAHEFLTDHWQPQHTSDLHQQLTQAELHYIGSANALDNIDELSVPGDIQPLLAKLTPSRRENLRDLSRNQRQRTDLFQKTAAIQATNADLISTSFQLLPDAPAAGGFTFKTPIGNIPAPAEIFTPLLQTLAMKPTTTAELARLPIFAQQPDLLVKSLQMLMWAGHVHPRVEATQKSVTTCANLNEWLAKNGLEILLAEECRTAVRRKTTP